MYIKFIEIGRVIIRRAQKADDAKSGCFGVFNKSFDKPEAFNLSGGFHMYARAVAVQHRVIYFYMPLVRVTNGAVGVYPLLYGFFKKVKINLRLGIKAYCKAAGDVRDKKIVAVYL
jgi:hypothetical protein